MRAIPCPISPDELRELVVVQKLTDKMIAGRLHSNSKQVRSWRLRFKIEANLRWARNEVLPIEGSLKSLLVGSMLGDGRLVMSGTSTRYAESHEDAQKSYLEWKAGFWGPWVKSPIMPVLWKTNGKEYPGWRFGTCCHGELNPWWELFYGGPGPKHLDSKVVDMVDAFAFAIWYLDDGNAGWWPNIIFGMPIESRRVAEAIFEKFGLKPRWQVQKGNTGTFHMEREDTAHKFLEIVSPHIPDCMAYKRGPFGFQGPHFQVREKLLVPEFREMAAAGVPIKQIARTLGVGASTVSRWLEKLKIEHPRKIGKPRNVP